MLKSLIFLLLSISLLSSSTARYRHSNLSPPPRFTLPSHPPPTTLSSPPPLPPPRSTVPLPPPPPPRPTVSSPLPLPPRSTVPLTPPPPPRATVSSPPPLPPRSTVSSAPQPAYSTLASMAHSFLGKIVLAIFAGGLVLYLLFPAACRRILVDLSEYVTTINSIFPI